MTATNRYSLPFAVVGFLIAAAGTIAITLESDPPAGVLMYFTTWSNIAATVLFADWVWRLRPGTKAPGSERSNLLTRLTMYASAALLLVTIAYWALLAPEADNALLTFSNLTTHLVTPALLLAFYLWVVRPGALRPADIGLALIFPLVYLAVVYIGYGFGHVYSIEDDGPRRFPYFFLDHIELGWPMVAVYMVAITVGVGGVASGLYALDRRRRSTLATSVR